MKEKCLVTVMVKIQCIAHLECNTLKMREHNKVSVTLLLNVLLSYPMCHSPNLGSVLLLIYTMLLTRLALFKFDTLFSCIFKTKISSSVVIFGQISCWSGQILVKNSRLGWKSRQIFKNLRRPGAIQTKRWNFCPDEWCLLLRYDTAELQEMGGGVERRVQKLWNGSGVFHYIG